MASFPLAVHFGGLGCAVATALSLFISTGYIMNRYYAKRIHLDIWRFWRNILSMSKGLLLLALVAFSLQEYMALSISWLHFFELVVMDTVLYTIIMYFVGMNESEKELVRKILRKLRR